MPATPAKDKRRNHICNRCQKAFLRTEHLNRHLLAHDKRKPFSCKACGASYGRNDVLQRHLRKCQLHLRASHTNGADSSTTAQHQAEQLLGINPVSPTAVRPFPVQTPPSDLFPQIQGQPLSAPADHGSAGLEQQFANPTSTLPLDTSFQNRVGQNIDFPAFQFEDDVFLEDSLLFQFNYPNHSGLTVPPTPNPYNAAQNFPNNTVNQIQVVTPESAANLRLDSSVYNALEVSAEDLQTFYENLEEADYDEDLGDFQRPSLSRTLRCLVAYFQHFDPHTPLVHFASFSVSESHPALVTIMLAIGAVHLSEHNFAQSAYQAVCMLLAQHDKRKIKRSDSQFQLWYAQATVLCSHFGVFAGDGQIFQNAQHHLFAAQTAMQQALDEIRVKSQVPTQDWETWIFLETCSRVISWLFVLSGVTLAWNPIAVTIIPPLPCPIPSPSDESVWHALSEAEWQLARRADGSDKSIDLWTLSKSVFQGRLPENCQHTSAFTLLSLIGAFLGNICTRQRLNIDWHEIYHPEYVADIERGLATWEGLWRRHPRAEQSSTRLDHALLNDCLSLLGSSYYHLYLGTELYKLKKIAEDPYSSLAIPACPDRSRAYKVIRYAANSWLVRAKLGVSYLNKTGGLQLGSQALITAYESALILAWWIHIQVDNTASSAGQSEDDRVAGTSVQRLLDEILNELDEQGVSYDSSGNASLSPIDFYVSLLNGWVWKCSTAIEQRLRYMQTRLDRRQYRHLS